MDIHVKGPEPTGPFRRMIFRNGGWEWDAEYNEAANRFAHVDLRRVYPEHANYVPPLENHFQRAVDALGDRDLGEVFGEVELPEERRGSWWERVVAVFTRRFT